MRKIHIRFTDPKNIKGRLGSDAPGMIIISGSGNRDNSFNQVMLIKPQLKRRITGVYILDHWGDMDKWFTDTQSSRDPLW